jgi:sulfite reductase (ferredoxin)
LFDCFLETNKITLDSNFKDLVYQINQNEPSEAFAKNTFKETIISIHRNIQTKDIADA